MDDDEIAYLFKLRAAHEETRRAAVLKKATWGAGAPSHLDIEIAQAEKGIRIIDAQINMVQPPQDVVEAIGPQDTGMVLIEHRVKLLEKKMGDGLTQVGDKVGEAVGQIGEVAAQVVKVADQVARIDVVTEQRYRQEQTIRGARQQEHDERTTDIEVGLMELREQLRAFAAQIDKRWWVDAVLIVGLIVAIIVWLWR